MSYALAATSLIGAVVGTSGTVDWTSIAQSVGFPPPDAVPHLALFNESPCGLQVNFQTGEQITLPAGGWQTIPLNAQCTRLTYQVLYVLNASPIVADLLGTWYAPGEPVPAAPILGNSPIGGSLTNTIAQELLGTGQTLILSEQDISGVATLIPGGSANIGVALAANDPSGTPTIALQTTGGASPITTVNGELTVFDATLGTEMIMDGGRIVVYNNEATMGNGVPSIVGLAQGLLVTSTAFQTPISYTTPSDGSKHSYRISAYFVIANGTSGNNLTYQWSYTDFTGVARTDTGSMLGSTTGWGGGTSITNSRYTAYPAFFTANPGTAITVTFRDPTNTPHDTLSVFLERLS